MSFYLSESMPLQGKSGVTPISRFDTSDYSTRFAGEIKELDIGSYINKKNARRLDDTIKYILVSGKQVPLEPAIPTWISYCSSFLLV